MERHKLWNTRAERLMNQTLESWTKKKKVYEDEEWGYDEEGNSLNPEEEEEEVTEQDFGDQGQLGRDMEKATSTSDKRSDRVAGRTASAMKLQDVLVTQVKKIMASATKVGEKELTFVLRKMLKNVDQLLPQQGGEEVQEMTGAEEYEDPEVQKAAEKARTAKIDSVKAQLKALQKQR
jgi:hypothetical protein